MTLRRLLNPIEQLILDKMNWTAPWKSFWCVTSASRELHVFQAYRVIRPGSTSFQNQDVHLVVGNLEHANFGSVGNAARATAL